MTDPSDLQRLGHRRNPPPLTIFPPDPRWPARYEALRARIHAALGPRALSIRHVGSTSVPGLPAKPILDIDIVVPSATDEPAYVTALVGEGWEDTGEGAGGVHGLRFLFREAWYQHRFFVVEPEPGAGRQGPQDAEADGDGAFWANVHVFGDGCPEVDRHRIFKQWLLEHPEDRDKYAAVKREAARASREAGEGMAAYTARKDAVIHEILGRALQACGRLDLRPGSS